jgi:hypothetical protein
MTDKKIFFSGCSYTKNSGFTEENRIKYHWPCLLEQYYDVQQTNVAMGGCSNDEIFYRTIEHIGTGHYDLAIVMWSAIGRHWVYPSNERTIDDAVICNIKNPDKKDLIFPPFQQDSTESILKKYSVLHHAYFNNQYMNLKRWLLQCIALADIFKSRNQPYIFALGFSNLITSFKKIKYADGKFIDLDNVCKETLHVNDNHYDYLVSKIKTIQDLIDQVEQLDWLNFGSAGFKKIDESDDVVHPGMLSNKLMYEKFVTYIDQRKLL